VRIVAILDQYRVIRILEVELGATPLDRVDTIHNIAGIQEQIQLLSLLGLWNWWLGPLILG
jgi:hypothetical protein